MYINANEIIILYTRILEFECPNVNAGGKNVGCEVELWDCSGDQK